MKERLKFIDIAKTIGIYLVVLGHYVYSLYLPFEPNSTWAIEHAVTLFHMPLFFIISGILFRVESLINVWNKAKVQLLKPYVYINVLCLILGAVISYFQHEPLSVKQIIQNFIGIASGGDIFGKGYISFSGALWFCFSLVLIKLVASVAYRSKYNKVSSLLICVVGGG